MHKRETAAVTLRFLYAGNWRVAGCADFRWKISDNDVIIEEL